MQANRKTKEGASHPDRTIFIYEASRFLLTSVDLPEISRVVEARDEAPCMEMRLRPKCALVVELWSRDEIPVRSAVWEPPMATE